ncbi:hypothetical protein B0H19DRAFT_1303872 [Mycena capillaripes]|nr:hypothetical protein B0H19DRAFT_1303872 [Mycena capillaripes]
MLRRQRSLVALIAGSASSSALTSPEDTVPPLPGAGVYSSTTSPSRGGVKGVSGGGGGSGDAKGGGGLIRRVSNLFRSGRNNASAPPRLAGIASKSTPDVRLTVGAGSPVSSTGNGNERGGGAKLVKRPSVRRAEKNVNERARENEAPVVSGGARKAGKEGAGGGWKMPISIKSTKSVKSATSSGKSAKGISSRDASLFSSSSHGHGHVSASSHGHGYAEKDEDDDDEEEDEEEDDIRRPSGLGRAASLSRSLRSLTRSLSRRNPHPYADPTKDKDKEQHPPRAPLALPHTHQQPDSAYASLSSSLASDPEGSDGDGDSAAGGSEEDEDGYKDEIRRPEGLGRAAAVSLTLEDRYAYAVFPSSSSSAEGGGSASGSGSGGGGMERERERARAVSTPTLSHYGQANQNQNHHKLSVLHELLRLPPPVGVSSTPSPSSTSTFPSHSSSTFPSNSTSAFPPPSSTQTRSPATPAQLPLSVWKHVFGYLELGDAARVCAVSRVWCEVGRGRVWGVVDMRGWGTSFASEPVDAEGGLAGGGGDEHAGLGGDEDEEQEQEQERSRRRAAGLARALRTPHLAARVEGVVCAGWPPPWPWEGSEGEGEGEGEMHLPALRSLTIFPSDPPAPSSSRSDTPVMPKTPTTPSASAHPKTPTTPRSPATPGSGRAAKTDTPALLSFLRAHPTLERLAVVGMEDDSLDDDKEYNGEDKDKEEHMPFLPRLTHLHAPPALAVRLLERIASAPFAAPLPSHTSSATTSTTATSTSTSTGTTNASPGTKQLSAASLALLAPDPKRGLVRLPGWHRDRGRGHGHNADMDASHASAGAGATAPQVLQQEREKEKQPEKRIPRKAPPLFEDEDLAADGEVDGDVEVGEEKVELRRVGSIGRAARAVYVQARPSLSGTRTTTGEPHPHPLRVLRLAVPRPLYEGAAAGGGRVGRAVGAVLARGAGATSKGAASGGKQGDKAQQAQGLAVHLLFGPRVERRTLEKVLRTLGSGLAEVVATEVSAACADGSPSAGGKGEKAPPSAWPARGRSGWEDTQGVEKDAGIGKAARGVALLEVRSPVRVAELYKIVAAVLPRYPALRTLLLTRPQGLQLATTSLSVPPSPNSPSFFFPSPPSTPSWHAPPSPSLRLRVPPSPLHTPPSPLQRAPPSPSLPPSPSFRAPPSPSQASLYPSVPPSPSSARTMRPDAHLYAWAWEWDGWGDAGDVLTALHAPRHFAASQSQSYNYNFRQSEASRDKRLPELPLGDDDESVLEAGNVDGGLSREDAAHVTAWRRRCAGLECVRMVSGSWWVREGDGE